MKNQTTKIISILFTTLILFGFILEKTEKNGLSKIFTNNDNKYIAINQCWMWISNNGMGSHNPVSDDSGFFWPQDKNNKLSLVFADGLLWGAKIGDSINVNGATYRYGLQAGKILGFNQADDPNNLKYRIYKVRKNWQLLPDGDTKNAYKKDYEEWPIEDGAPWIDVDNDGKYTVGIDEPEFLGDEMLWCVSNDLDLSRTTYTYGSLPIGLEIHTLVFGFDNTGDLGDMVFKKYTIINKSESILEDMYLAYWSDADVGNAADDYCGCDTLLNLSYTYNADNVDEDYYGSNPPAVGYALLQGPIIPYNNQDSLVIKYNLPDSAKYNNKWKKDFTNLPMTSHIVSFPDYNFHPVPTSANYVIYNWMKGKFDNGQSFIDPNTGKATSRILAGDPVLHSGWYEGLGWQNGPAPGDRRNILSSGPFSMVPGDTQEVVIGIIAARGTSNLKSVYELKRKTKKAIFLADNDFNYAAEITSPELNVYTDNNKITLYWNDIIESYDVVDKMLSFDKVTDSTYTFEGYFVKQFNDIEGSGGKIIAEFDKENDIDELLIGKKSREYYYEELFYDLKNLGVERSITISRDSLNETNLINNNPYYFAVTAFAVSEFSIPKFIESKPIIIEVFPGSNPTDIDLNEIKSDDYLYATSITGPTNAEIKLKIVDPTKLTGDKYQIFFNETENYTIEYSLQNITTSEILLNNMNDIVFDTVDEFNKHYLANLGEKQIVDGFTLYVRDLGKEKIDLQGTRYAVEKVLEIKGPEGKDLDTFINVEENLNSTEKWKVKAQGANDRYNWQAIRTQEGLGYDFYEIRFTEKGSDFFASGYNLGTLKTTIVKDDQKGTGKVPFEIWNIGQTIDDPSDDKRLIVKILDNNLAYPDSAINDMQWSRLPSGNWEEIYCYEDSLLDPDNLPEQSGASGYTSHKFGAMVFCGEMPEEGTVIRLYSVIPLLDGDIFEITMPSVNLNSKEYAKTQLNTINVFPNPYYAAHALEWSTSDRFVRFINLPKKAIIRIFNLGGTFIQKIEKDDNSDFVDWNLRNKHDRFIASGLYLAYIEITQVGTKVLKLAVIQEDK